MIDILLATCNSAPFLRQQIDSILAQSETDWRLLIRDGGSTDETLDIIREYCRDYPGKIVFLESKPASALENFSELLGHSTGELVMFADHDDLWLPEKIAQSVQMLHEMEKEFGETVPLCVFTDAFVTDEDLQVICDSNLANQHLDPVAGLSPSKLLVQNVPSGNTMLFNAKLRTLIDPIPVSAVMHDHYTALAAACLGRIRCLPEKTLYYRQHGKNVLGSSRYSLAGMFRKFFQGTGIVRKRFFANCRQAAALLEQCRDVLDPEIRDVLAEFAVMEKLNWFQRRTLIIRRGLWKNGFLRNLGMLLII